MQLNHSHQCLFILASYRLSAALEKWIVFVTKFKAELLCFLLLRCWQVWCVLGLKYLLYCQSDPNQSCTDNYAN